MLDETAHRSVGGPKDIEDPNELVRIEAEALQRRNDLSAVAIIDQQTYEEAVGKRTAAKEWIDNVKAWFKPMKDAAHVAHKKICDNERDVISPVEAALAQTNRVLVAWDTKQEQLRRQAQFELEREAMRKAEDERIAQAEQMKTEGADEETIDAVLDAPVQITEIAVAAPTYEKSSQITYRDNWGGECTDLFKLVQAVAKDKSKIGLLMVNQPALNQMAKALKESMSIPGCRPVNNRIAATGRG